MAVKVAWVGCKLQDMAVALLPDRRRKSWLYACIAASGDLARKRAAELHDPKKAPKSPKP